MRNQHLVRAEQQTTAQMPAQMPAQTSAQAYAQTPAPSPVLAAAPTLAVLGALAKLRSAAVAAACLGALLAACAPQLEPAQAAKSDAKDAGGVDAEFAVKGFALGNATLTLSSPKNEQVYPVAKGGTVSIDVVYTVANFTLGQVRCQIDGTFVGQGNATTYKFVSVGKGAHTLSCVLADNTGTESVDPLARFNVVVKIAEPCVLGSDCVDSNACSDEACVDLQCVYGMKLFCCPSKYSCAAGETCVNPNTATSKCSSCAVNADCNDNESCTTDVCDLSGTKGVCKNTKANAECCSKLTDPCDDGKSCTVDSCNTTTGLCKHVQPAGVCCKDSDCAVADPCLVAVCVDNSCRTGPDIAKPDCCTAGGYNALCDDKNYCTIDKCDKPQIGGWVKCSHTMDASKPKCCEVGNGATNAQCDDLQPCTADYCDNYVCKNVQIAECCKQTLDCDDNNPCTTDKCDIIAPAPTGKCSHGKVQGCCTTVGDCDDNLFCTIDSCTYAALTCKYTKTDPACCDLDSDCQDGKTCTVKSCVNHTCVYTKDTSKPNCCDSTQDCNDGNACTVDTCTLPVALPVTTGLVAHYDARVAASITKDAAGNISQWNDLSGNSRHLTVNGVAPVYKAQGIMSKGTVDFDGTDRRMTSPAFPITTDVTVFAVIQYRTPDGWGAIAHHGSRDMDWSLEQNMNKAIGVTHFQSNNDNAGVELTLNQNTNYILSGRIAGSTREYTSTATGASLTKATGTGNSITLGNKVLWVGSSDVSEDSRAWIGQILYYNRALSDTERGQVLDYLRSTWVIDSLVNNSGNTCTFVSNGVAGCCNTNADCNDNDCTTEDFCDGFNKCKSTLAVGMCKANIDCDDGKPCTVDTCATVNGCGQCQYAPAPAGTCCDNDAYCSDGNPCSTDKCDLNTHKCTATPTANCCKDDTDAQTACNDNNACTIEYCLGNTCHHTVPKAGCCATSADCNDNNACTTDTCSNIVSGKGACTYVTAPSCNECNPSIASSFNDNNICTSDICTLSGSIYKQTHTPIPACCLDKFDCNDGLPCTYDECVLNECVHLAAEGGVSLCCDPKTEAVDCAYLNSSCADGKCVAQTDGSLKCTAVEKTPCVVNLSYCQDFEGTGTLKQMGWLPGDVNGTASTNWGVSKTGPLGPDQYARLTWTPTKTNFLTCLQSPVVQAAGAAAITMQFDRSFLPALSDTTLTVRGSLGGAAVNWNTATIIDGPIVASSTTTIAPEKITIKLPTELSGSNGLRLAFCVAASSSLNFEEYAVDNVCIVKGTAPKIAACPANQTVALGTKLTVPLKVADPDAADIISFSMTSGPSYASVSSALYYWLDSTWNSNVTLAPTALSEVGDQNITVQYTDGFLTGSCTFKVTVTYQGGYLIWQPSPVPKTSATAIKTALTAKGQFGQIVGDLALYPDLSKFLGVFVTLGVYPNNHPLLESEVATLKTYLSGGGKLYMEGGDTFMFDAPTTLHPFFKIKGIVDSSPNGVTGPVKGYAAYADTSTSPPTPKVWAYDQTPANNNVNDEIDANTAVQKTRNLLRNDGLEKFWVAVGHDDPAAKYRTIGSSVPFSGILQSGTETQTTMMERILTFFANGFVDCKADADCDDGNACTADKCTTGTCTNDNTCLCGAQTTYDCGANQTKLVTNGGDSTQATSNYSCDLVNTYSGKEVSYGFKSTTGKPVTVEIKNVTNPTKTHLFIVKATSKGCDPLGCIAHNATKITFAAGANIQYYIVVDTVGVADSSQFDLSITCGQGEDCTNGKDDNANTLIDCQDKDSCCGDPACQTEICNGIDDNCSGQIDEGCDDDGDGWCDSGMTTVGKPPICLNGGGDCNDTNGTVNPGVKEICGNGKDDNCNGVQDEANATGCINYYTDLDGDGYGTGAASCLCAPSGTLKATKAGDCNDAKPTVNPGAIETCATTDDDNCDGSTNDTNAVGCTNFYTDFDGDLYGTSVFKCTCVPSGIVSAKQPGDCDDANAGVNPGITEICNAVDDNCNGQVDEGCDDDKDGYCDTGLTYAPPVGTQDVCNKAVDGQVLTLTCPAGGTITTVKFAEYGTVTGTCPTFTKGGCDAVNEIAYISSNCVGKNSCSTTNWHLSLGDPCVGVVKTMAVVATCSVSGSQGTLPVCPLGPGDTDDTDPAINPAGKEICDGKDNNSDGQTDENCDKDKDGYCDSTIFTVGKPKACPLGGGDCNDAKAAVNPGVQEDCSTPDDDNCNGGNNDVGAAGCTPYFFDADADLFGTNANKCYCVPVGQYSAVNPGDCNDDVKTINPNAKEICDNIDNDCDKTVDNGCDDDGDQYCDSAMTIVGTPTICPNGGADCVDTDPGVNPGKAEVCGNGKDDNCDGSQNDLNAIGCIPFYADADLDTYGAGTKKCQCTAAGTFTSTNSADCDDTKKAVNPGALEACDNLDNNCNGTTDEGCDDDGDKYCDANMAYVGSTVCPLGGGDCNDTNATVFKGKASEVCDGLDDDCDGKTDNGCDDDADGYCDAAMTVSSPLPAICAKGSGDCDDYDSSVNPGAKEVCNNLKDDNCNGSQNDPNSIGCTTFYSDSDGDTYGLNIAQCLCSASGSFKALVGNDCDDTNNAISPAATEKCDGVDNNCDTKIDEPGATGCVSYYYDNDKDGYGLDLTQCQCAATAPFSATQKGDCDDTNASMNPGKPEICDNLDNNCNTQVDEGCNADGDQFCSALKTVIGTPLVCPLGGNDCNDADKTINPAGVEVCDGKDNNCNGAVDEGCDDDKDGYCDSNMTTVGSPSTCPSGGGDCNDLDVNINPGKPEICGNTVDENCSGSTNDPDAQGCSVYYVDFDGDGYGKGSTTFQKLIINEFRRNTNGLTGATGNEYIEFLVTADITPAQLMTYYFGDSTAAGDAKFGQYKLNIGSLNLPTIKAGTFITIAGQAAGIAQDTTYNPAGNDWSLVFQSDGAYVTTVAAGGDFAASDVCWIDTSNTGTTTLDSIRYSSANGLLGAAAKVQIGGAPANGTVGALTGVVAFVGDITTLDNVASYTLDGPSTPGTANGGNNSTFVSWLQTVSLKGDSKCLCTADAVYKTTQGGDCNDSNATVFTGATEICDGVDNNCNSVIDEKCDQDGDGYCDLNKITIGKPPICPNGGGDCDDLVKAVNPGATESCLDSVDTNCDGILNSDGATGCVKYYYDGDNDGYGANVSQCLCGASAPFKATVNGDCDDTLSGVNPAATENCATAYDDNCNGNLNDTNATNCINFYNDVDKDGFGVGSAVCQCVAQGTAVASVNGDCNDGDNQVNPGKAELCDNKDNNCNGAAPSAVEINAATGTNNSLANYVTQEIVWTLPGNFNKIDVAFNAPTAQSVTLYLYKSATLPVSLVSPAPVETIGPVAVAQNAAGVYTKYTFTSLVKPAVLAGEKWYFVWKASSTGLTIQESSGNQYPKGQAYFAPSSPYVWSALGSGNTDVTFTAWLVVSGATVDEGCDDDLDQYCDSAMAVSTPLPTICPKGGGDCNDNNAAVNINTAEACDNLDNNCNGVTDEGCDADGDQWCAASKTVVGSPAICPLGKGDCDDGNKNIYPGKAEICDDLDNNCSGTTDEGCNADNDGYCSSAMATIGAPAVCTKGGGDCADSNAAINPGATEVCDGIDNNCAGGVDEVCSDNDKDGYCNGSVPISTACPKGGGDCDDSKASVNPGAQEDCSTVSDDNCNGFVNEVNALNCVPWYPDADADGYGSNVGTCQCTQTASLPSKVGGDCLDTDKTVNPGAKEICDGKDNDCAAGVDNGCDDDADGYCDSAMIMASTAGCASSPKPAAGSFKPGDDCNDNSNTTKPGVQEICDDKDTNCDGVIDDGCDDDNDNYCETGFTLVGVVSTCTVGGGDCNDNVAATNPAANENCSTPADDNCDGSLDKLNALGCKNFYFDNDGDGFGTSAFECHCVASGKYTALVSGDCDDNNPALNSSSAPETCDGADNNCNGATDEGCDTDGDKYCDANKTVTSNFGCSNTVVNAVTKKGDDCDDLNKLVNPGAIEACDGIDNNCTAGIDELCNKDNDGYCDASKPVVGTPAVCTSGGGDCDDNNAAVKPSAAELCNSKDDNCNGQTDEAGATGCTTYYYDGDNDGFGVNSTMCLCAKAGFFNASNNTDCNDNCAACAPGKPEICDGNDNNCNGSVDEGCNADGDGYCAAAMVTVGTPATCPKGGGDCNDASATINPGAPELCNNIDDNCNGTVDEQASDSCPIDKNATFKCSAGQCVLTGCASGFYDLNGSFSDGCECNGNDLNEPNDTCATATLVDASMYDNAKSANVEGKVVTTDIDWYSVYASDLGDGGYAVCDQFNLRVFFVKQPGGLAFDVFRGSCPAASGANNQGVCCNRTSFNWFANFKGASGGENSRQWSEYGECPCSTGDTFDQSNWGWWNSGNPYCMNFNANGVCYPRGYYMTNCKDDSAWFYVKVYRPSGAATCGTYKLEFSNGLYGQPGTGNGKQGY